MIKISSKGMELPYFDGDHDAQLFYGTDDVYIHILSKTRKEDYEAYAKKLAHESFSLYDSHAIGENYFSTYVKNDFCVQLYYTACNAETRIITQPDWVPFPKRSADTDTTARCGTMLYQFELDYKNIDCGMCYIIRSSSGNLFVIDSAHMNSVNDHIRIHDFMKSLTAPGEKIHIKGWFFSHAHQDHIAKFIDFIQEGFNDYSIEKLYYNFPSLDSAPGHETWKSDDNQTILEFNRLIADHPEFPVCKLHTGNHFFIDNLEFEVLGTHEDIYPMSVARFNEISTVLMLTVDNCKVFFPGDANIKMSDLLVERYGNLLKCDIAQLSHHGFNGGTCELYDHTKAPVLLVPTARQNFEQNLYREPNQTALNYAEEVYICGDGTAALPLPYTKAGAQVQAVQVN